MFDKLKQQAQGAINKVKMVNAAKGLLGGDFDFAAIFELIEPFLTDENIAEGMAKAANWKQEHENRTGCSELAYLIRSTPDRTEIYVDVLKIENNAPVATIAQYNKSNLRELLEFIKDANTAKK